MILSPSISKGSLFIVLIAVFASGLVGCGDGRAGRVPVAGTITIDGAPLAHGSVTFMPVAGSEGKAGGGSLGPDGRFQISSFTPNDGLVVGKYTAIVSAIEPINNTSQRWHAPQIYSRLDKSELIFEIKEKLENMEIKLTWEKDSRHSKPFVERF